MNNMLLGKYHYLHRHTHLRNKPNMWFVEITNACNINCSICPRNAMTRKVGYLKFDLFKKIIDKIKGSTDFVWLHQFGEPLLHPELGLLINYCYANGIKTGISTNATILDTDKAKTILNSSLSRIILCMDSVNRETYEKLRCGASFEKTKENIVNFLYLAKKLKRKELDIKVQMIETKQILDEVEIFKKEWGAIDADIVIKEFCRWGDQIGEIVANDSAAPCVQNRQRYPCEELWTRGGVQWNGDFVVCCMDFNGTSGAGNIFMDPLMNIWNSPPMIRLRKEHVENNYVNPLCKNCTEWSGSKKDVYYPFSRILQKIGCYVKCRSESPELVGRKFKTSLRKYP